MGKKITESELELLDEYTRNIYKMLGISAYVCHQGKILSKHRISTDNEAFDNFLDSLFLGYANAAQESCFDSFADTGCLLMYGVSFNKESGVSVFLGPIRTDGISLNQISKNFENDPAYDYYKKDLFAFLTMMPVMNIKRFLGFFKMMDIYLTKEKHEFEYEKHGVPSFSGIYKEEINYLETREDADREDRFYDSEQQILFYVKNGMVWQVDEILKTAAMSFKVDETGNVRRAKDNLISGISLVARAAMEMGVNSNLCFHMQEVFNGRVESCYSYNQLRDVRFQAVHYYTEKVAQLRLKNVTSPIVLRIIKYINDNIDHRVTCDEISKKFNINRAYVSTCFKTETGIGIVDYINMQKIDKAKQLLKFTDKSLVDITYCLSFSSQAYFTKIFKDVVGMTPLEFRENQN